MVLNDPAVRARLAGFIASAVGAKAAAILETRLLSGGAIQENWLVVADIEGGDLAGHRHLVLRTNAATPLGIGLDRAQEFAVLRAVHAAGVKVPEPLLLGTDPSVLGQPFFVMRRVPGTAIAAGIVADPADARREALAERLGRELAHLHAIRPPRPDLEFLGAPPADAARARILEHGQFLERSAEPHPVAEWGLRWLVHNAPPPVPSVLCHGDFRTGNYLVEDRGLAAVLDWEFAGWGDPDEDIGWFCSRCWRFGADAREAGGLAPRAVFHRGYEAVSGRRIDPARVHYWEVMAALRYLTIALRERDRFLVGGERSLHLALIGRRVAECELEILRLTEATAEVA